MWRNRTNINSEPRAKLVSEPATPSEPRAKLVSEPRYRASRPPSASEPRYGASRPPSASEPRAKLVSEPPSASIRSFHSLVIRTFGPTGRNCVASLI